MTRRNSNLGIGATVFAVSASLIVPAMPAQADVNAPLQQSNCEIRANQFKDKHPHLDVLGYWKAGILFFGDAQPPHPPQAYHDAASGIVLHVETDGRHVTAIDASGKVLWVRNPFVDGDLCPYRSAHPYISWIGAPGDDFGFRHIDPFTPTPDAMANARFLKELNDEVDRGQKVERPKDDDRFIGLTFDSSQQGFLNIRNGYFYFGGQN